MEEKIYERNSIIHFSTMNKTSVGNKRFEYTALVTETKHDMIKMSHCWCTNNDADYGICKNVLLDLNSGTITEIREATANEKEAFQEALDKDKKLHSRK